MVAEAKVVVEKRRFEDKILRKVSWKLDFQFSFKCETIDNSNILARIQI